jgi:RHS repeat-associated protein
LPGIDRPFALVTDSVPGTGSIARFFHQDELGNVIGLTRGNNVEQRIEYQPWGEVSSITGTVADTSRLRWKGLFWEGGNTRLYYARNRWYDPEARRFTSQDPIGLAGGRTQYAFGENDPINFSDPAGLCPENVDEKTTYARDEDGNWVETKSCLHTSGRWVTERMTVFGQKTPTLLMGILGRSPARGMAPNSGEWFENKPGEWTYRTYSGDGRAVTDFDWGHDHTGAGDPHAHDWDWNRPSPDQRGDPRRIQPNELESPWSPYSTLYRLLTGMVRTPLIMIIKPDPCAFSRVPCAPMS